MDAAIGPTWAMVASMAFSSLAGRMAQELMFTMALCLSK